jgi:hypothetical protein
MTCPLLRRRGPAPPLPALSPAVALLLVLVALSSPLAAQPSGEPQPELSVHVITLQHQSAREAMMLVLPLLSTRGTVELRPGGNTLVVRDTIAALSRILPVVYNFDHPARAVEVELWLIRASGRRDEISAAPPAPSNLPPELLRSLLEHLPYRHYQLVAASRVRSREGQRVTFDLATQYTVRFRLGTIVGDRRLRLNEFEVLQKQPRQTPQSLVRSQLNLWMERNMVLAMSGGEQASSALMVVVRCRAAATEGP